MSKFSIDKISFRTSKTNRQTPQKLGCQELVKLMKKSLIILNAKFRLTNPKQLVNLINSE